MRKTIWAVAIAAALALAGLNGGPAIAQTPAAKDATDKAGAKSDKATKAEERKAKAEERKAKREAAKKAGAEKKSKMSAARAAVRERQKQCGGEWREAKKSGKLEKGMTWPKFWSACNTRLKAKSG